MRLKAIIHIIYFVVALGVVTNSFYKIIYYKKVLGTIVKIEESPDKLSYYYCFESQYNDSVITGITTIGDYRNDRYYVGERINVLSNGRDSVIYNFHEIFFFKFLFLSIMYFTILYLIIPSLSSLYQSFFILPEKKSND